MTAILTHIVISTALPGVGDKLREEIAGGSPGETILRLLDMEAVSSHCLRREGASCSPDLFSLRASHSREFSRSQSLRSLSVAFRVYFGLLQMPARSDIFHIWQKMYRCSWRSAGFAARPPRPKTRARWDLAPHTNFQCPAPCQSPPVPHIM